MKQECLMSRLSRESAIPVVEQGGEPEGRVGGEGERMLRETPLGFAVMLIRHARRSRGIGAPRRRVA